MHHFCSVAFLVVDLKMADKQAGIYVSAISVLKRAIELDAANRLDEAVVCYQEGLQLLITYLKGNLYKRYFLIEIHIHVHIFS